MDKTGFASLRYSCTMKKLTLFFLLLAIGTLLSSEVLAQRRISQFQGRRTPFAKNKKYVSVGLTINALNYFGDLAPKSHIASTKLSFTRPGFGITGMYRIGPQSTLRGSFMWGRLKGDDFGADPFDQTAKYRYMRNLQFRNDIKELSVEYVFDFIKHQRTFITRHEYVPYAFAGIALFHHNPKARVPEVDALHFDMNNAQPIQAEDPLYGGVSPGDWVSLRPLGTEGQYVEGSGVKPYSNWQIAIPFGLGIRYKASRHLDLAFEVAYRQTFTDYLDDVSGDYINPADFGSGPEANLARLMADRSKEAVAVVSGKARQAEIYTQNGFISHGQLPPDYGDGSYQLIRGFGHQAKDNIRGMDDSDIYIVTKIQVTYIIGNNIRNAKFR